MFIKIPVLALLILGASAADWSVIPIRDRPMTMPGTLFRSVDLREEFSVAETYAKVCIARKEYDRWRQDPARAGLARHLEPVGKNLVLLDYDAPVAPYGLVPLYFPGHTPGHTVFRMPRTDRRGGGDIYFVGDIVHAAELQIPRPGFCARFDMDMETAVKSRRELLGRADAWYGAHLPFPGIVRIERSRTASGECRYGFTPGGK